MGQSARVDRSEGTTAADPIAARWKSDNVITICPSRHRNGTERKLQNLRGHFSLDAFCAAVSVRSLKSSLSWPDCGLSEPGGVQSTPNDCRNSAPDFHHERTYCLDVANHER